MDDRFLREAIGLSRKKMQSGEGGPFGAVVVRDGQIVGTGWNRVTSTNDPTAHAEICAIRDACERIENFSLKDCDIYSSCEPCPMCLAAILWARIERIFFAAGCEDAAKAGFDDGNFYEEVSNPIAERSIVMQQHLRDEANEVFLEWIRKEDKTLY